MVDPDGEDIASKGRVILLEAKKVDGEERGNGAPMFDLSLIYEKEISHGPVTSVSCLTCEGKSRLVLGAGADVNVEQWGGGKLTQVGFFRATMLVHELSIFKNFFLLSDA